MRVEVLSDYPGAAARRTEELNDAQRRRVVEHRRAVVELRNQQAASRRWWQVATWWRQRRALRAFQAAVPLVDPRLEHRLAQQVAGVMGEELVTAALGALSDEWVVFRGYTNRKGEVDHLLLGPGGVWAVEVKRSGVRVHVDGDRWSFEKFDRYGNLVDRGPLRDGCGRSWVGR